MPEFYQDVASALVLALLAYGTTNLDNLLIIIALLQGGSRVKVVVPGFLLAASIVLIAAMTFSAVSLVLPPRMLGWLGLIPILVGVRMLLRSGSGAEIPIDTPLSVGSVAVLLVGNNVDTLAAFGPLFAESETRVVVALVAGYAAMVAFFAWLATHVSTQFSVESPIAKWVARLLPYLMIAIGFYILLNTGTDTI